MFVFALAACGLVLAAAQAQSADVRLKDLVDVEGVRTNRLTGFGLVTGLNGTGGSNPITRQFALNMLERFGLASDPLLRRIVRDDARQRTDNISVVTVTADLPVFARPGSRLDVVVSTYDDATSLQGGVLMLTPLVAVDGKVYATASGEVSIGGFSFSGQAATVTKNHPTTGRVPNGATVEECLEAEFVRNGCVRLLLRDPDFETARRVAAAINQVVPGSSVTLDPGTVKVSLPQPYLESPVRFLGEIGGLRVQPDTPARVVINERTGTVVVGENVRISRVAITHANLSVITSELPEVSQPAPFSRGETAVVPRTDLQVTEDNPPVQVLDDTITVKDLARALNLLGVTPRDISSIFQMMKQAGALHAELRFE